MQFTAPGTFPGEPLFLLIGATYALNILWALTLKWAERFTGIVDVQLACDALVVSGFIAVTGGITSYFAALYVLPIAAASSVQFRRGGMMIATLSALLYVGIVLAQYFGLASLVGDPVLDPGSSCCRHRASSRTRRGSTSSCSSRSRFSAGRSPIVCSARARGSSAHRARSPTCRRSTSMSSTVWRAVSRPPIGRAEFSRSTARPRTSPASRRCRSSGGGIEEVLDLPAAVAAELINARRRRGAAAGRESVPDRRWAPDRAGFTGHAASRPAGNAGLLFAFQDVTDIKKLERDARLRQRLAAVGEMAAGIAHEIRNPLASMSGSIQILRQELPLTEEQAQLMDIVLRESERLNDTISSFLAYARPQRFSIARLDVRRVLNDAALLLRNSSEVQDGHVIDVRGADDEVAFEADENQIRQIVWNLATNGLRAMRNGGPPDARRATRARPARRPRVRGARSGRRRRRHSRRRARRDLSAFPRHVREGHRPRVGDCPPHRQRLQRRDSGELHARPRNDGECEAAGQGGGSGRC